MIGHVVFNSAYATVVIQARMATLTDTLEQAAADLGATPWRVFRRVTLPLILPGGRSSPALLIFSFSFDDVVTSLFLGGTDVETLPVLLLGLIRLHVTPEVNAIGVLVMLTTTGLLAFAAALTTRARGGRRTRRAGADGGVVSVAAGATPAVQLVGHRATLRRRRRRSTASTSRSPTASSSRCSGRAAAARPRRCG